MSYKLAKIHLKLMNLEKFNTRYQFRRVYRKPKNMAKDLRNKNVWESQTMVRCFTVESDGGYANKSGYKHKLFIQVWLKFIEIKN